jgi:hypothetical protein
VQAAETSLGRRVRCIACSGVFIASEGLDSRAKQPSEEPAGYPLRAEPAPPQAPAPREHGLARHHLPLCPRCHRPVGWEAADCPHCGHLLDPRDALFKEEQLVRRDAEPHRGQTIDTLGTLALLGGAVSLCGVTAPLGLLAALGLGIPALVMARRDLEQMRTGGVDPGGQPLSEFGRNKALVGIILGMMFGLFWFLVVLESYY